MPKLVLEVVNIYTTFCSKARITDQFTGCKRRCVLHAARQPNRPVHLGMRARPRRELPIGGQLGTS